jgi:hypothetical protein
MHCTDQLLEDIGNSKLSLFICQGPVCTEFWEITLFAFSNEKVKTNRWRTKVKVYRCSWLTYSAVGRDTTAECKGSPDCGPVGFSWCSWGWARPSGYHFVVLVRVTHILLFVLLIIVCSSRQLCSHSQAHEASKCLVASHWFLLFTDILSCVLIFCHLTSVVCLCCLCVIFVSEIFEASKNSPMVSVGSFLPANS